MPYSKPNTKQAKMFEQRTIWEGEWQGMPEYEQDNMLPLFSVRVNFASLEDLKKFAALVQQTITAKTASIWYPKQDYATPSSMAYFQQDDNEP